MSRSETIHIRVTPETRELVEAAAKLDLRSTSDWGAVTLERAAKKRTASPAKKVRR